MDLNSISSGRFPFYSKFVEYDPCLGVFSTTKLNKCTSALPFIWNGKTYNSSAIDTVHFTTSFGCDSSAILILNVSSINTSSLTNINICPSSLPFIWNGRTYNSSKTDTIHLVNSAGCDSSAIIILIVKPTSSSTSNISICSSALPYTWNGRTYNAAKTDTVHLVNSLGCDSSAIIILSVKLISSSTSNISICSSALPYTWNGRTYNAAKTDTIHFVNSLGCDSAAIIILKIIPTSKSISNISICQSSLPYIWNGITYNSAKTDTIHFNNSQGCDSAAIIILSIKPTSLLTSKISICQSALPYNWNGKTYNTAITDTIHLVNSFGCDSAAVIILSVKPTSSSTNNISICPSSLPYTWNGRKYTNAKTDTIHLVNSVGCDSAAIMILVVKSTSSSTNSISICPSSLPYTWNGRIYNTPKTDTVRLVNSLGCDSLAIIILNVKSTSSSLSINSICSTSLPYIWNGRTYNSSKIDTVHLVNAVGCDSACILNLTINQTPNTSNINGFANLNRLDTATYSVNGMIGSVFNWNVGSALILSGAGTNQIQIKWLNIGIDTLKVTETSNQSCIGLQKSLVVNVSPASRVSELEVDNNLISYPNPTSGIINVSSSQAIDKIEVFDLTCKLVYSQITNNKKSNYQLDLSSLNNGMFFINLESEKGVIMTHKIVVLK